MKNNLNILGLSLFFLLSFAACKTGEKAIKDGSKKGAKELTQDQLIIGDWELVSISIGDKEMPSEMVAGAIRLKFDGKNVSSSENNNEPDIEGYKIEDGQLRSTDKEEEAPMFIKVLNEESLILEAKEGEDVLTMGFKRVGE